jgi:hypothetical protein
MNITNYLFSVSFGGASAPASANYDSIYEQFCNTNITGNCGSRHTHEPIRTVLANSSWGYPADPDPCSACHNPHTAQRIGSTQYNGPYNPNKSPISRPSEHTTNPTNLNLWGDDYQAGCSSVISGQNERMICYAKGKSGIYQSPYYGSVGNPTTGPFEPAGNATKDGSNLPDYVTLCLDCHINSVNGRRAINWGVTGDKHGGRAAGDCNCAGNWEDPILRASGPYTEAVSASGSNYVLSCTDCHEPHGTPNERYLFRRFINGELVPADTAPCFTGNADWQAICARCHDNIFPGPPSNTHVGGCASCHWHGATAGWCCGGERVF